MGYDNRYKYRDAYHSANRRYVTPFWCDFVVGVIHSSNAENIVGYTIGCQCVSFIVSNIWACQNIILSESYHKSIAWQRITCDCLPQKFPNRTCAWILLLTLSWKCTKYRYLGVSWEQLDDHHGHFFQRFDTVMTVTWPPVMGDHVIVDRRKWQGG